MKQIFRNLLIIILFNCIFVLNLSAENIHFIDFNKVLNQSTAGAEAQKKLQNKFLSESKKFKDQEEEIKKQESDLTSQKKAITPEDYKNKVEKLRQKVSELQKNKQNSLDSIAKSRNEARQQLIKAVNPILKKYMEQNNIRLILDKQSIILGDVTLEVTDKIIEILNQDLKSIKFD